MQVATREEIVETFLSIPYPDRHSQNWGCYGSIEAGRRWDANKETYINGMLLVIDLDDLMGYLIECVDRTLGTVHYHAIVTHHGGHDSMVYEPDCGTFYERTEAARPEVVSAWAVEKIYGMLEGR